MTTLQHDVIVKTDTAAPALPFESIEAVIACLRRGQCRRYSGETISHWEHALQTAALALQAQAAPTLVTAALLHDIGHLMQQGDAPDTPTLRGLDDRHENTAPQALQRLFGPAVTVPIALHVQAKRYLVSTTPGYLGRLSADSRRSLALQGGPMRVSECEAFRAGPFADDALRLRCWDDLAKSPDAPAQRLERFLPALQASLLTGGVASS